MFLYLFCFIAHTYPQVTKQQIKERKQLIKSFGKSTSPIIVVDKKKVISTEEFIHLQDSLLHYTLSKNSHSFNLLDNDNNERYILDVTTLHYIDSLSMINRQNSMKSYRENELRCFFGDEEPLILFGTNRITKKDYINLREDTVAFVNFYVTDFIKEYYAPEGDKGIVYVCPRRIRSNIKYTDQLSRPANGRNYIEDFPIAIHPYFKNGDLRAHIPYLQEKVKEYKDDNIAGIKASVEISCVINTDGTIVPLFVEQIHAKQSLENKTKELLVTAANKIIQSMPNWEPGKGIIYNMANNKEIEDPREFSITIILKFGQTK